MKSTDIKNVKYGVQTISKIKYSAQTIWEKIKYILSCFSNGYWINDKRWTNNDGWKNN